MKYCGECGSFLETREVENRGRAFCPLCRRVFHEQLKVGAGMLIERDEKILLLRRTQRPFAGCWNLPAGYVEVDESPASAAERETFEEVGLRVEATGLVDVYFFDDDPRGNGILILYRGKVIGGQVAESAEGVRPTFFGANEIPADLAGGGHDQAIHAWQLAHP